MCLLSGSLHSSFIFMLQYFYFSCVLCIWLVEVTDTDFHPSITAWVWGWGQETNHAPHIVPPLVMNAGTCDWTACHCFEIPPPASLVCGRSEVLWGCCRGREIRTPADCHTPSSAGYSLHLSRILMSSDYSWCFVFASILLFSTLDKGIFRN